MLLAPGLVLLIGMLLLWRDPQCFWVCDNQLWFAPIFEDIARAWRGGEWPILTHCSWATGNLAGEYQCGTFSLFANLAVLLAWNLPLSIPGNAAALSLIHLAVLAAGVFLLARRRGLHVPGAVLAALIASCNGWMLGWAASDWFSSLAGFVWVPWVWWALLGAAENRSPWRRWVVPAICFYLLLAAGNPFSVLMGAIVGAWLGVRWLCARQWSGIAVLAVAWCGGLGLSAPAWLALIEFMQGSAREEWGGMIQRAWIVPWQAWLGLILPSCVTPWLDFNYKPSPHVFVEMSGALVPVAALLVGAGMMRGRLLSRWRAEFVLLAIAIALSMLPGIWSFRWSFRWLPLVHLTLALLGAAVLQELPRRAVAAWALASVLAAWALTTATGMNASYEFAAVSSLLVALWWAAETWAPRAWWPVVLTGAGVLATSGMLPMAQHVSRHRFEESLRRPEPLDPTRLYLGLHGFVEVIDRVSGEPGFGAVRRPCNTPMHADLRFLNGYSGFSAAGLPRLFEMHGGLTWETAVDLTSPGKAWLLDLLGVDGLVIAPRYASIARQLGPEWQLVHESPEGRVFHCKVRRAAVAKPVVVAPDQPRLVLGQPPLRVLRAGRQVVEVAVEVDPRPVWLAFPRPWYPGYEATLDGKPLPVRAYQGMVPVVELPPRTEGVVRLRYRPVFLRIGVPVSLTTASALLAAGFILSRRSSAKRPIAQPT